MSKEDAQVAVTKHLDQLKTMLENAECEFEEGLDYEGYSFIEINGCIFKFDSEGNELLYTEKDIE